MRMKIGYFHDNDRGLFKGFRPRESGGVGTVDTRPVSEYGAGISRV